MHCTLTIFAAPLRPRAQRTKTHLSVPCMNAIQTRCSFLSREPSSPTLTIAPRRNMTGTHGRDRRRSPWSAGKRRRRARMEDEVNKCAASAFQAAAMIYGLRLLRAAYCDEQMGAAHKAVVTADLNQAINSVLHANAEFCQGVQEEAQQHTRRNEQWLKPKIQSENFLVKSLKPFVALRTSAVLSQRKPTPIGKQPPITRLYWRKTFCA